MQGGFGGKLLIIGIIRDKPTIRRVCNETILGHEDRAHQTLLPNQPCCLIIATNTRIVTIVPILPSGFKFRRIDPKTVPVSLKPRENLMNSRRGIIRAVMSDSVNVESRVILSVICCCWRAALLSMSLCVIPCPSMVLLAKSISKSTSQLAPKFKCTRPSGYHASIKGGPKSVVGKIPAK